MGFHDSLTITKVEKEEKARPKSLVPCCKWGLIGLLPKTDLVRRGLLEKIETLRFKKKSLKKKKKKVSYMTRQHVLSRPETAAGAAGRQAGRPGASRGKISGSAETVSCT